MGADRRADETGGFDRASNQLTEEVIGAAMHVLNTLGTGFLEKVYERALAHELQKRGFKVETQKPVTVYYDGVEVGHYVLDSLVNDELVLEGKTIRVITEGDVAQTINYLTATRMTLALILNFGNRELQWKRLVNQHVD